MLLAAVLVAAMVPGHVTAAPFDVSADVALASLVTIADGHLKTMADGLETLASTDDARTGQWEVLRAPLRQIAATNVGAALFYARPDGSYWTLDGGRQRVSVADRPYFGVVMSGRTSIGDLVRSRSTGRMSTVVAVPVKRADGSVSGVLGASIYLDDLSAQIVREMHLGPNDLFWAIDSHGTIALHSDPSAIFVSPASMSPQLARVTAAMLHDQSGTQTYEFRGRTRTVVFRASAFTGWRYGFGRVQPIR